VYGLVRFSAGCDARGCTHPHLCGACQHSGVTQGGEDVRVIGLRRVQRASTVLQRRERTSAREHHLTVLGAAPRHKNKETKNVSQLLPQKVVRGRHRQWACEETIYPWERLQLYLATKAI